MDRWSKIVLALGVPLFLMGGCTSFFKRAFDGIRAQSGYAEMMALMGLLLCCLAIAPKVVAMGTRGATLAGGALVTALAVAILLLSGKGGLDSSVPWLLVGLVALASNAVAEGRQMASIGWRLALIGLAIILVSLVTQDGWRWWTWSFGYSPNSFGTVAARSGIAAVACGIGLAGLSFFAGAPMESPWQWLASGDWVRGGQPSRGGPVQGHLDDVARRHIADLERERKRDPGRFGQR